jgi:hypothetical protein
MSTADLDLLAHHVAEPVDLFRIVKGSTRSAPAVLDSLRSNYERDAPPRGVERESVLIHLGLSMFVTVDAAAERPQDGRRLERTLRACAWSQVTAFISPRREHGFIAPSGAVPCSCSLASPISCL